MSAILDASAACARRRATRRHAALALLASACTLRAAARTAGSAQLIRVASDIHAGSCWAADAKQHDELFHFLAETSRAGTSFGTAGIDALVLNGDVLDFWLLPVNRTVPSYSRMLQEGIDGGDSGFDMARFRALLGALHVPIHEDAGNHDNFLDGGRAASMFQPEAPHLVWEGPWLRKWAIAFQHGHAQTLFNAVPPNTTFLPIGYFVTRAVASFACISQNRISGILSRALIDILGTTMIDLAAVEILATEYVFEKLIRSVLFHSTTGNLPVDLGNVPVVGVERADQMPLAERPDVRNYTLEDVVHDYRGALGRFVESLGRGTVAQMLQAELSGSLLDIAVGSTNTEDDMVVLGHTHVPDLRVVKRDLPGVSVSQDVLIANSGAWVDNQQSYLDITIGNVSQLYPECFSSSNGSDYRGRKRTTTEGKPCVSWGMYYHELGPISYCRNPDGSSLSAWCYTSEYYAWGWCDIGLPSPSGCPALSKSLGPVRVELWKSTVRVPLAVAVRDPDVPSSPWNVTWHDDSAAPRPVVGTDASMVFV